MCITVKLQGYKECTCTCTAKLKTITDNLLAIHGCFECNTYCVTVLARLNEERKENSEFQLFTVHWLHEKSSWTLIVRLGQYMTAASIGFRH